MFTPDFNGLTDTAKKPRFYCINDLLKRQTRCASDRTFPDMADPPSHYSQGPGHPGITGTVAFELGFPPVCVGGWDMEHPAMVVPMPETAIDKNHCPVFRQDDIRSAGITPVIDAVTETTCKQCFPYQNFRSGVLCPDTGHHPMTGFRCKGICHNHILPRHSPF